MRDWPWGWPFVERQAKPGTAPKDARPGTDGNLPHPFAEFTQPSDPSEPATEILLVEFDLLRVELASAPIRHSLNLWNHVDELRVDPALAPVLAQNGLRAGVALPGSWPAIKAILNSAQASTAVATQTVQVGLPLLLQMGRIDGPETVFLYRHDGELVGQTLAAGRRVIRLDYEVLPPKRDRIRLLIELDIFPPESAEAWVLSPSDPGGRIPSLRFDELLTGLVLEPGEVVVIGPHENTTNGWLLGSRYFTDRAQGRSVDTLLLITVNLTRQKLRK